MSMPIPPMLAHPILEATAGLHLILLAALQRRLPMPFAAAAHDYTARVTLTFHSRAEVLTWAAALEVAEVEDRVHEQDGLHDITSIETAWLDVPLLIVTSIPRDPR